MKKPKISYHHHSINPENFLDREKSWLQFNQRVLHQVADKRNPLLERLRFSEIFISNLDEYYMKRIGPLNEAIKNKKLFPTIDGKTPKQKNLEIRDIILSQFSYLREAFDNELVPSLAKENIFFVQWKALKAKQKKYLSDYFRNNIFPVLTPLAVDSGHPFPFISNLSKSLAVSYKSPSEKTKQFARIKIPTTLSQWIRVRPTKVNTFQFISIEELIINNLDMLLSGMEIQAHLIFRATRNAEIVPEEETSADLMESIEEELKERKFAPIIRLEHEKNPDPWILNFLKTELNVTDDCIYEFFCFPNYTNFKEIYTLEQKDYLKFQGFNPITPPDFIEHLGEHLDIFSRIKNRDVLVHHPYQSFNTSVESFIREACTDPHVEAIKLTLYRTDAAGRVIEPLLMAAEKGKQVVCVVELKARFEEEKNIRWAQKLESEGIHVIYGILGSKTHSKMTLVVRREGEKLQSYAHLGTGNYNSYTAKVYEDLGLFTANPKICSEVMEVFNHLTGKSFKTNYKYLLVAPFNMKSHFLRMIKNEIKNKKAGMPAEILAKFNSLEDIDIINALYEASKAGVKINLTVRGFSCLRPGVKGLSDNINVYSLVGRFLEHSRIYYFRNGAKDPHEGKIYMGSADWMHRNLENRVEVVSSVLDKNIKKNLYQILQTVFNDNLQLWKCDENGDYRLVQKTNKAFSAQNYFLGHYLRNKRI